MSETSTGSAQGGAAGAIAAAADDLEKGGRGAAGAGETGGAAGGEGGAAGGGEGGGAASGGAPWYAGLDDKAPAEGQLSDKAWIENKKYADLSTAVKSFRELEKQYLSGEKIVKPGENASPEQIDAFHKAIGRPESADGYAIEAPEGVELDEALVGKFRETAFKAGLPAAMAGPLVEMFIAHQREQAEALDAQRAQAKSDGVKTVQKEWGDKFATNVAHANRAMKMLELDKDALGAIEDGLEARFPGEGTKRTLDLFRKLGAGMGEDALAGGGGARQFGVSPNEAQAELDRMKKDPQIMEKLKDPAFKARRDRLMEVVAAAREKTAGRE